MSIVLTILGLSLLVILHEFGHYLTARAFGMRVSRFSLGFGPTLLSAKRGDTTWQVAAIPLGGFVQIDGMGPAEEQAEGYVHDPEDAGSYRNKPAWQRALVIFAGPAANWLICAGLLCVLAATQGFTRYDNSQAVLGELVPTGAAAQAGLQPGDHVRRIGDTAVSSWNSLVTEVRAHPAQTVLFEIEREGAVLTLPVTPKAGADGHTGMVEAMPLGHLERCSWLQAPAAGARGAWNFTVEQARLLGGIFTGHSAGKLSGLPGIIKITSEQARRSLGHLAESLAWLSIGLCLLNLAPIPALDGSRLFFLGVEMIRRRPVDERLEGMLHTAGFVLLLGMMIFVSVRDLL